MYPYRYIGKTKKNFCHGLKRKMATLKQAENLVNQLETFDGFPENLDVLVESIKKSFAELLKELKASGEKLDHSYYPYRLSV